MGCLPQAHPEEFKGGVPLLSNEYVTGLNARLAKCIERTAADHLGSFPDSALAQRVRAYDHYQRFTVGRAQTGLLSGKELAEWSDVTTLQPLKNSQPDASRFPADLRGGVFSPLVEAARYSTSILLRGGRHDSEEVMLTVFCHRVVVRPQERYQGFLHRDLAPGTGRIGTVVWYPQVRASLIDGAVLMMYLAGSDVPLETLRESAPDYKFTPASYDKRVLVMGYPDNYAHGVSPGINPVSQASTPARPVRDFVDPPDDYFVKDLVIVTVSERSPVED